MRDGPFGRVLTHDGVYSAVGVLFVLVGRVVYGGVWGEFTRVHTLVHHLRFLLLDERLRLFRILDRVDGGDLRLRFGLLDFNHL